MQTGGAGSGMNCPPPKGKQVPPPPASALTGRKSHAYARKRLLFTVPEQTDWGLENESSR
ncbi:hypothetical protein CE91St46_35430 [Eubacteriales bacterium]|nr:hypothetical protein CE91St46_35430 [Eubacteriales bacterium]GKH65154.1 hypothetical protein CE91St47_36230 [Eubacteriales bacterium]